MALSDFLKARHESTPYKPLNDLERDIMQLWKVPEKDWFRDRYQKALEIILSYIDGKNMKHLKHLLSPNHYLIAEKFDYLNETYLFFTDVSYSDGGTTQIHNWFQFERLDKTHGENFVQTFLLLSSDNNAKTQGGILLAIFDQNNK